MEGGKVGVKYAPALPYDLLILIFISFLNKSIHHVR